MSQSLILFLIGEHGIPEGPDHLIKLLHESHCNLCASTIYLKLATHMTLAFDLDHVPNAKALCISIDPGKAVGMGVKFFHSKEVELFATGDWNRTIPVKALKSVVELEFTKETLE